MKRMKGRKYKAMIRKLAKIDEGFTTCSTAAEVAALSFESLQKMIIEMTSVPKQPIQDGYQCHYIGTEIQSNRWFPLNIAVSES